MPEGGEYDNLKAICDYLSRLDNQVMGLAPYS